MELTGKIIAVMPAKSGTSAKTGNAWMTQEYVFEVPGQFPRRCAFSVFGEDRIKQFNIQTGDEITIQFDIDAREFNGRWYNDVRAYNIIRGQQPVPSITANSVSAESKSLPFGEVPSDEGEILPF